MKRAELGQIVYYEDAVMEVVAIGEGRAVMMMPVGDQEPCPTCGMRRSVELLEHSPLFQERVQPVRTIGDQ